MLSFSIVTNLENIVNGLIQEQKQIIRILLICEIYRNHWTWIGEKAQWVNVFAAKTGSLGSVSEICSVN